MAIAEETPLKYTDATTLTIVNKAQPGGQPFQRIEVARYPELTPLVTKYYRYSTGLAVTFRTDSRNISARWTTVNKLPGTNTTLIAQRGLDLYIRSDGKWVFAGVGVPAKSGTQHEAPVVENMDTTMKECLLNLPLYDEITRLDIGIDEGAQIEAAPDPFRHRIVVIGSSITHGASASRPGMTYTARLGRTLGFEFINLGASGQCKLDTFFARIAAETRADAFVFDVFSNPSAVLIEERLEEFVRIVRESHPTTPLIFLQTEVRESGNFDLKKRAYEADKREAARKGMEKLLERDKNIRFINPCMDLGNDHEATVDGVHPTDLGFGRMLDALTPQIARILRKYGIE
jgi:lysophospholipase L1-like esterase